MRLHKTVRGGSWYADPRDCRSAYRDRSVPGNAFSIIGFRVVCNEESPPSHKTLCGGAWIGDPWYFYSAYRVHDEPGKADDDAGFRVVCTTSQLTRHDQS